MTEIAAIALIAGIGIIIVDEKSLTYRFIHIWKYTYTDIKLTVPIST